MANPNGRPLTLTEENVREAVEAVRCGLYMESVAALLGVHIYTFRRWLARGAREQKRLNREGYPIKPTEALCYELCCGLKKALSEQLRDDLQAIRTAGSKCWQARAWLVERRWAAQYGPRAREIKELTAEEKRVARAEKRKRDARRSAEGSATPPPS